MKKTIKLSAKKTVISPNLEAMNKASAGIDPKSTEWHKARIKAGKLERHSRMGFILNSQLRHWLDVQNFIVVSMSHNGYSGRQIVSFQTACEDLSATEMKEGYDLTTGRWQEGTSAYRAVQAEMECFGMESPDNMMPEFLSTKPKVRSGR